MMAVATPSSPHVPVLCREVIAALALNPGDQYVDGTFGAGGYTSAALALGVRAYGIDRDPSAIAGGAALAGQYPDRLTLIEARFADMQAALAVHGVDAVDAIALDIGVSSMQIDQPERGFSYNHDGRLDMRMEGELSSGPSAADYLNSADEAEIADVIFQLGDEPKARRIARAIVADRPLTRTSELARLVRSVCGFKPGGSNKSGKDPAAKTFQAIRIHINDELGELAAGLRAAERLLRPGGRLAVVSFHSLEDRAVKAFLRARSGSEPGGSRHMPVGDTGPAPSFSAPAKAVRAGSDEVANNPRARSATLRAAIRTAAPAWRN